MTIILVCIYQMNQFDSENSIQNSEILEKVNQTNFEIRIHNERRERHIKEVKRYCKNSGCDCEVKADSSSLLIVRSITTDPACIEAYKKMDQMVEEFDTLEYRIKAKIAQLDTFYEIIKLKREERDKEQDAIDVILIIGICISTIGFLLWYNKVQKYQDIILKQSIPKNERNYHLLRSKPISKPPFK